MVCSLGNELFPSQDIEILLSKIAIKKWPNICPLLTMEPTHLFFLSYWLQSNETKDSSQTQHPHSIHGGLLLEPWDNPHKTMDMFSHLLPRIFFASVQSSDWQSKSSVWIILIAKFQFTIQWKDSVLKLCLELLNGIETLTLSVLDPPPPRLRGVKPTMIQEETGVM